MRGGSRKLYQSGYNFENDFFFFFFFFGLREEGFKNPNTTIRGPSLAIQQNVKWRFAGGPMMAQLGSLRFFRGSGPVLPRNPIFL